MTCTKLFHDEGRYHIETSPLICRANQWTGFCMITISVMNELNCDVLLQGDVFEKIRSNSLESYAKVIII